MLKSGWLYVSDSVLILVYERSTLKLGFTYSSKGAECNLFAINEIICF